LDLDLTYREGHPKAGQPLDKVCFIGANGTGKTTLLQILGRRATEDVYTNRIRQDIEASQIVRYNVGLNEEFDAVLTKDHCFLSEKNNSKKIFEKINKLSDSEQRKFYQKYQLSDNLKLKRKKIHGLFQKNRLYTFSSSESFNNTLLNPGLPKTNLNEALKPPKRAFPHYIISPDYFKEFWKLLIYHTNKRTSDETEFIRNHQDKIVGELLNEFNKTNPDILEVIAELWSKILDRAGLYFDYEKAKRPFQLLDNLEAYIKLKSNDEVIPYNKLSSGIRDMIFRFGDMIFRFGYLKALYFGRDIDWATALIDEPENSLFVDLQYNIIELYEEVCPNTQLFFATHSPIIAAQFHPDERVILEFDDEGYVTASRGVAAEGDDPNDVLVGDFKRKSVLGKVGEEKWQRYVELIHLMENEKDEKKKVEHAKEFMKIGSDYKFGAVMTD